MIFGEMFSGLEYILEREELRKMKVVQCACIVFNGGMGVLG